MMLFDQLGFVESWMTHSGSDFSMSSLKSTASYQCLPMMMFEPFYFVEFRMIHFFVAGYRDRYRNCFFLRHPGFDQLEELSWANLIAVPMMTLLLMALLLLPL